MIQSIYHHSFQENRVRYNQCNYRRVFEEWASEHKQVEASESEPSLSECVQRWLERTPGLEEHGFNFPAKFKAAVDNIFEQEMKNIQVTLNKNVNLLKFFIFTSYLNIPTNNCTIYVSGRDK